MAQAGGQRRVPRMEPASSLQGEGGAWVGGRDGNDMTPVVSKVGASVSVGWEPGRCAVREGALPDSQRLWLSSLAWCCRWNCVPQKDLL